MVRAQSFAFKGADGQSLLGTIELPNSEVRAHALFAHCFTCTKASLAAVRISRALTAAGFGVLRFDFTGLGQSGGDFSDSTFSGNVDDLIAAANAMAAVGREPGLLIGHSLGGAAVLAAAGELPGVKAVSTISAPFDVKHVTRLFEGGLEAILRDGEADVNLGGRPFRIRRAFVDDLEKQDQGERIRNLRRPLLILHAPLDAQVGIENATDIFLAAKHPKSFVSLDNADHLIVRQADAEYAAQVIAAWASRYVGEPVPLRSSGQPGEVLVQETGEGNFEVEVVAGNARFIADEPPEVGGNGSGPTPYDLLSAALAACTSMTLRLYARHKGLTLGRISVAAAHAKKPRDQFTRNISVDGPVTPEMRAKLLEIADKCPVHRTLTGTATITSSITDPDTPVVPSETPMQHAIDADQILEGS